MEAVLCGIVGSFMFAVLYYLINPKGVARMGEQGKNFYLLDNDLIKWQDEQNLIVKGNTVIPPQEGDLLDDIQITEIWRYEFIRVHVGHDLSSNYFDGQVRFRRHVGNKEPPPKYLGGQIRKKVNKHPPRSREAVTREQKEAKEKHRKKSTEERYT